ncbi:MAG: hypothetical protein AAB367_00420 [Patescibacteria group bacterium]
MVRIGVISNMVQRGFGNTYGNVFSRDGVEGLLEPDWVPPEVFFGTFAQGIEVGVDDLSGEYRLALAVLEDAIALFQLHACAFGRRDKQQFEEVSAWFTSRDCSWPYSFESICSLFGFDSTELRQNLWKWRRMIVLPVPRTPRRANRVHRHSVQARD